MESEHISVIDLASELGRRKQTIFKVIKRLNIETQRLSTTNSRGQLVHHVAVDDAKRIREELTPPNIGLDDGTATDNDISDEQILSQRGVFYLLQLEPKHDPGRFKVGFATDLAERLRHHRCSAPFAAVVKSWACRSLWEKTAIDCVTDGCERLHTEVFRTMSINTVITKCEQFFELMPRLMDASLKPQNKPYEASQHPLETKQ
ncbi:MAG: hypothetical protein ABSC47_02020 [Terracidiphilus sp.]|jgi:hypothetical protein